MSAGNYPLNIEQGADYHRTFTYRDAAGQLVDLTGYKAYLQIKVRKGGEVLHAMTSEPANGITLGARPGRSLCISRIQPRAPCGAAVSMTWSWRPRVVSETDS